MNFRDRALEHRAAPSALVIVVDGLRDAAIVSDRMPWLTGLAGAGTRCTAATTVIPAVTRAAAAALTTGRRPRATGILGNRVRIPRIGMVDTGSAAELRSVHAARGRVIEPETLGEMLAASGRRLLAIGTGSTGCGYLLRPEAETAGGAVVMAGADPAAGTVLPAALGETLLRHHEPLPPGASSTQALSWAVDVATGPFAAAVDADVLLFWCGEPDKVQHAYGLGDSRTLRVLADVDAALGRLVRRVRQAAGDVDVIVTSDHGMIDLPRSFDPGPALFDRCPAREHVDVCHNAGSFAVHLHDDAPAATADEVVSWCLRQEWADVVFAAGQTPAPGARRMAEAGCDHPELGPDVLITIDPAAGVGIAGARRPDGGSDGGHSVPGTRGTHGTLHPEDLGIPLVLSGPSFRAAHRITEPTSILDVLPTLLVLLGLAVPGGLDGTVLHAALDGAEDRRAVR